MLRSTVFLLVILSSLSLLTAKTPYWEKLLTQNKEEIPLSLPEIQETKLENGIQVRSIPNHQSPLVSIYIAVDIGSFEDSQEKTGLTSLWGESIVFSGSEKYPRERLAEILERRGSSFNFSAGFEHSVFSLTSLKKNFPEDLQLVLEVLSSPRFAAEDINLLRERQISALKRMREQPGKVTSLAAQKIIYGDHPRGRTATELTLKNITQNDLAEQQKKMANANRYTILLSGDYDAQETLTILNDQTGSLSIDGKAVNTSILSKNPEFPSGKKSLVPFETPQTTILMYAPGLPHNSKDYYRWKLLDFLLGGDSFNSTLTRRIRTENGWAYVAYSFISTDGYTGKAGIMTQTANKNVPDVLNEIDDILKNPEEYITEEALERAKTSLRNRFVFIAETPSEYLLLEQNLRWEGLDENYLPEYLEHIDQVTREDVLSFAREYYAAGKFATVVTGPKELAAPSQLELYPMDNF